MFFCTRLLFWKQKIILYKSIKRLYSLKVETITSKKKNNDFDSKIKTRIQWIFLCNCIFYFCKNNDEKIPEKSWIKELQIFF